MSFLLLALVFRNACNARPLRMFRSVGGSARFARFGLVVPARGFALLAALVTLSLPSSAAADWTVYLAGHIGISTGKGEATGNVGAVDFDATDRDSSPMIAGSVGLTIPMDELMAWQLPYDMKLPDWPVRTEIEFAGLRDFEYRTLVNDGPVDDIYLTSSKSWAMMVNGFVDVPTTVLTRPLAWTFQTRKSTIRRILDPLEFYAGAGVGTAQVKLDAISTAARQATSDDFKFAWQVGTGFGYELTPFVTLDVGYRFFKTRDVEPVVTDSVGNVSGDVFNFSQRVNEFRAGIRVNLYSFRSPWARLN